MNPPSEPVFTRVRLCQSLPPVTLYEIKTDSPEMAAPLYDSLPLISTLRPVEVAVPLPETSRMGVGFDGEGVGDGVGVGSGVNAEGVALVEPLVGVSSWTADRDAEHSGAALVERGRVGDGADSAAEFVICGHAHWQYEEADGNRLADVKLRIGLAG